MNDTMEICSRARGQRYKLNSGIHSLHSSVEPAIIKGRVARSVLFEYTIPWVAEGVE